MRARARCRSGKTRSMEICWEAVSKAALHDERGPVVRPAPGPFARQRELCLPESAGGIEPPAKEAVVEETHQLGGGLIVDGPVAGYDARRSRGEKGVRQSDQTLARDRGSATAPAGAQDGEIGWKVKACDLVREQDAVPRPSLEIEERQRQPRELPDGSRPAARGRRSASAGSPPALRRAPLPWSP